MITTLLSSILFIIFTVLGFIHVYWLFDGKWGLKNVIPTKENQSVSLSIPKLATLMVAFVLLLFGLMYLLKSNIIHIETSSTLPNYSYWIISSIFILRAIGDFKYVGFFKKIKNTQFSKADSKWYIPLCLIIGIFGILIQLIEK